MKFEIKDTFYLDGNPFQIISGAIHYFRVVPEYWRDRLEKLKAMGCNTVETYIPWNFHEPEKGKFRFDGMADLCRFVKTAQELGLYVILRPSPYICAEWEFGGLPAWLLAEDGMKFRLSYKPFLKHVEEYYRVLMKKLAPLQINYGGPVILMQVENEYGYYANDKDYLNWMRDLMQSERVVVPLVTSDGPYEENLAGGTIGGGFKISFAVCGIAEMVKLLISLYFQAQPAAGNRDFTSALIHILRVFFEDKEIPFPRPFFHKTVIELGRKHNRQPCLIPNFTGFKGKSCFQPAAKIRLPDCREHRIFSVREVDRGWI